MVGLLLIVLMVTHGYSPFPGQRSLAGVAKSKAISNFALEASINNDRSTFGSKLMADITEEELSDIFKEFNITNYDLNKDPELAKWAPSK